MSFKVCFIAVTFFVTAIAGTIQIATTNLDAATAEQCRTQDWPVSQHSVHHDFCVSYGYPTPQ